MGGWRRVSLVGPTGTLRAPGQVVAEIAPQLANAPDGIVLTGHLFGHVASYARLLCRHLGKMGCAWAIESDLVGGHDPALLRLAWTNGCRALLIGPDPDPLLRDAGGDVDAAAAELRRIRRAGLLTVVRCALGRPGDDAGVFGRTVWLCTAGRVAFPRLERAEDASAMSRDELARGLAWTEHTLYTHRAIWRRTGLLRAADRGAMLANYRTRRVRPRHAAEPTPAMRLARAVARPIAIRERVPFVSTLVGAVQASGGQMRNAWLRARAMRDETLAAVVIRLEGTVDARAARKLVARVRRGLGRSTERIIIDVGGVERVSLTVLTRFLEEHAGRLAELRGRLAFRNLGPALAALRGNLHGMLPNAALLERGLEEAR